MKHVLILFLSAACICSLHAAEKKAGSDKKSAAEKEEEAVRAEAQRLMSGAQTGRLTLSGTLTVAKDLAEDAKPFPKLIGLVAGRDGNAYPIMVLMKGLYQQLAAYDRKEVTVMAKLIDRGEKGKFYAVDEMVLAPAAPEVRRKRGGL